MNPGKVNWIGAGIKLSMGVPVNIVIIIQAKTYEKNKKP